MQSNEISRNRLHASRSAIAVALLIVAAGVAWPTQGAKAQATQDGSDPSSQAREQFSRGVEAYEAGRYQQALAAFQEAYRLKPHPSVHVNLANCYAKLGKPLQAVFHFERFLELAGNDANPAKRREVEQALEELRQQVGTLRLDVAPDGATIHIDDAETRQAPVMEPIRLEAGEHVVSIEGEGFQTVRRTVTVAGGGHTTLAVRLKRLDDAAAAESTTATSDPQSEPRVPPAPASSAPQTPAGGTPETLDARDFEREEDGLRITMPTVIAGAATASTFIAALVTGLVAQHYESKYQDALPKSSTLDLPPCRAGDAMACEDAQDHYYHEAWDAAQRANSLALATDILLGASLVGAGVTAYFFIRDQQGEPSDESLVLSPSVTPTRAGLDITGRF